MTDGFIYGTNTKYGEMFTDWSPPPVISAAIVSGCLMPVSLVLLGRVSSGLRSPGLRYGATVQGAWLLFLASLIVMALARIPAASIDYLAGAAIMASATIFTFIAWSLIAWGFTLNMLLALSCGKRFVGLDDWIEYYTGGGDIRRLATDRASLLLAARFAIRVEEINYRLTISGRIAAKLVTLGQWTFAIRSAECKGQP